MTSCKVDRVAPSCAEATDNGRRGLQMIEIPRFRRVLGETLASLGLIEDGPGAAACYFKLPLANPLQVDVTVSEPIKATDLPRPSAAGFALDAMVRMPDLDAWVASVLSGTAVDGWAAPILMRAGHIVPNAYLGSVICLEGDDERAILRALADQYEINIRPKWIAVLNARPMDIMALTSLGVDKAVCVARLIASLALRPDWCARYELTDIDEQISSIPVAPDINISRMGRFAAMSASRAIEALKVLRGAV
jgi:hypothetical protein